MEFTINLGKIPEGVKVDLQQKCNLDHKIKVKLYLSYFYNIRFFPTNLVPVSTAVWDPKWYHDNKGNDYRFFDKRGIYNGVRLEELNPSKVEAECIECKIKPDISKCGFIRNYSEYLDSLDFDSVMNKLHGLRGIMMDILGYEITPVIIVHEAPWNPCSERKPLIDWFTKHGVEIEELQIK